MNKRILRMTIIDKHLSLFKTKGNDIQIKKQDFIALCEKVGIEMENLITGEAHLRLINDTTQKEVIFETPPMWPASCTLQMISRDHPWTLSVIEQ